ncbi:protein of unknown function (plasmid) [Cupriavidus taiwanensis]|uniref:Uncharacterized protein n=1 Tax=Cupriavidus taiwanensis TaxID=164546 RepID=A0A9Q7UWZ7_9BURK|nr:protein of unknown function [Cupriavidus taiwanensis]
MRTDGEVPCGGRRQHSAPREPAMARALRFDQAWDVRNQAATPGAGILKCGENPDRGT